MSIGETCKTLTEMAEGQSWEALLKYKNFELQELKREIENWKEDGVPEKEVEELRREFEEREKEEKKELQLVMREMAEIRKARKELEEMEEKGVDESHLQPLRKELEGHERVAQKLLERER